MKKHKGMNVFGAIIGVLTAVVNLLHGFWTFWLIAEQIKTGWGYSTNLEMLVLMPWMLELICLPVLLTEVVYFIMSCFKRHDRIVTVSNIVLFSLAVAQYIGTNLFIFY